jgi:tetratricopeptide (TPR) repeat protein
VIVASRARRGLPLRARPLVAFLILTIVAAIPMAGARALMRGEAPPDPVSAAASDPRAAAELALAYLQRVRVTADPAYYAKAEDLVRRALAQAPEDVAVRTAAAGLALARHEFDRALEHAVAAARLAPRAPIVYAALVDALVEMGRYDDAVAAAQVMVDLRPDLPSLSRVSYLRELHGDTAGAIDAMRRAVAAGAPRSEATAWSEVQLGHLLLAAGEVDEAELAYRSAAARVEGYAYAAAGLARVHVARGDLAAAVALYADVARRLPVVEHFAILGDLYARMGDVRRADEQYALVEATQRLFAASGVRTDVDLALFDLDHGRNVARSLAAVRAEHAARPSIHVAGALAWAEHHAGDHAAALRHSEEALRLGTRDALMLYRGAVIAANAGDLARSRELLSRARAVDRGIVLAPDVAVRVAHLAAP